MPYKDPIKKREYQRQWHQDNPEYDKNRYNKNRQYFFDNRYRWKYGITYEQKKQMLINQGEICVTCENPLTLEKAHVDHCHTTKAVRGIVCHRCNVLAGYLETTTYETMLRMVRYLWGPTCV